MTNQRRRLYQQLEPAAWSASGLSPVNRGVAVAIVCSVAFALAGSEPLIVTGHEHLFDAVEFWFGALFGVEYLARLWTSAENPKYGGGLFGRLRYMRSPAAVLDLLALSPLLISAIGGEAYLLRLLRLLRVLRLAKLGRFSHAISAIAAAVRSRRFELTASVCVALLMLLVSSTLMYLVEGGDQPEAFGSIPRAMWWSIATLTTVGYGDAVPMTVLGRLLAGATAVTGIGLIAMPTGILAAAFSDAMQARRAEEARRQSRTDASADETLSQ